LKITKFQNGFSHPLIFLSIAIVLVIGFIGYRVYDHNKKTNPKVATVTIKTINNPQSSNTSTNAPSPDFKAPLASGTDNSTLNSNLNNINSSLSQENNDNTSVNSGLNDSSNQISVPTN
jgi:hypothetical protein